jgi:CheY-like chemotaxis protein
MARRPPPSPLLVWLIDDSEANHQVAARTTATLPAVDLVGFYTGDEAVAAFAATQAGQDAVPPHVVLMDFYLGDERGDHVTAALRAAERRSRPVIVGYSSVESASRVIVAAGADLVVRKHADGRGINPSLARYLKELVAARS